MAIMCYYTTNRDIPNKVGHLLWNPQTKGTLGVKLDPQIHPINLILLKRLQQQNVKG